jgi:hypothetical protein
MINATAGALLATGCLGVLALAACARQGQDEMSWARGALERNERIEVVAADPQSRTFTVRMKDTGDLRVVRADQVVGGPASAAAANTAAPTAPSEGAAPAAPAGPASADAASSAAATPQPAVAAPAASAAEAAATQAPSVFASRALHPGSPARPVPGQVLEAGPGYTIEAGSAPAAPAASSVREPGAGGAVERRYEPIVCQGARLLHIDNLNLQFEGDAVSAEDGCEIHITNSRIRATGVGVSARAANVHIDNSLIEGDAGSIDASDGAQIYTASSRFRGLSRRLDTAAVHDLGGNVWN